jgi:hypothetical protein
VVHGEDGAIDSFSALLRDRYGMETVTPSIGETYDLADIKIPQPKVKGRTMGDVAAGLEELSNEWMELTASLSATRIEDDEKIADINREMDRIRESYRRIRELIK